VLQGLSILRTIATLQHQQYSLALQSPSLTMTDEFTKPLTKPFSIVVVGGGIGGLAFTLSLLKHQVPVTLYEGAPAFGEIGALAL
jgi:pyruvate/2-oxoglutarate dehydrogenase complex dihydrolipoamide dehydrogenase (E3) component